MPAAHSAHFNPSVHTPLAQHPHELASLVHFNEPLWFPQPPGGPTCHSAEHLPGETEALAFHNTVCASGPPWGGVGARLPRRKS